MLALMFLAACGNLPAGSAPTAAVTATHLATEPPTVAATIAPTAAETQLPSPAPTANTAQAGDSAAIPDSVTQEGYHVLGRPDAPVTLVMYSDFL